MRKVLDNIKDVCHQADVAAIIVHYPTKDNTDRGVYTARGAGEIGNAADNIIIIKSIMNNSHKVVEVKHQKSRNFELLKPFQLLLTDYLTFQLYQSNYNSRDVAIVVDALKNLGGRVETQKELVNKVMKLAKCKETKAKGLIEQAVNSGKITEEDNPNGRSKCYTIF